MAFEAGWMDMYGHNVQQIQKGCIVMQIDLLIPKESYSLVSYYSPPPVVYTVLRLTAFVNRSLVKLSI